MKVKNSNKVLILILVLTITIPFLVAQIFLIQVRTNKFEIERNVHREDPLLRTDGSLAGVKAIKLVGLSERDGSVNPNLFATAVLNSDLNSYSLQKERKMDSMVIQRLEDTLIFTYYKDTVKENNRQGNMDIRLKLNLSANIPIYAQRCKVAYGSSADPLFPQSINPANFYLGNGAVLELGSEVISLNLAQDTANDDHSVYIADTSQASKDHFDSTFAWMGEVHVFGNNSIVTFVQPVHFKGLALELQSKAKIELQHPFRTPELSGKLEANTQVTGDAGSISALAALLK